MQLFLESCSKELTYLNHEIKNDTLNIFCGIIRNKDQRIRTYYTRKVKDLNYAHFKVILFIKCPVYYYDRKIDNSSFIHKLDFIEESSHMTKRLYNYIIDNMKESSAIGLERTLKKNICDISDTTILRKIKKKIQFLL